MESPNSLMQRQTCMVATGGRTIMPVPAASASPCSEIPAGQGLDLLQVFVIDHREARPQGGVEPWPLPQVPESDGARDGVPERHGLPAPRPAAESVVIDHDAMMQPFPARLAGRDVLTANNRILERFNPDVPPDEVKCLF